MLEKIVSENASLVAFFVIIWITGLVVVFFLDVMVKYEDAKRRSFEESRRNVWIEEHNLPPCKGVECYRCANIGYITTADGKVCVLGCAKGKHPCKDFSAREIDLEALASVKKDLGMSDVFAKMD